MQSIISNNGFGFCKASGFRNCNNCIYRIRCIFYAPIHFRNAVQTSAINNFNLQNEKIIEQNLENNERILPQENIVAEEKTQDLKVQALTPSQNKNIEIGSNKTVIPEEGSTDLQVYENKNIEIYQTEEAPLKAKRGIFGTKFVEDKSKKK